MDYKRYKFPRTFHIPNSKGITSDDKIIKNYDNFIGKEIIITEKMDGENTSLYSDSFIHARSINSDSHESRDYIKNWWSEKYYLLPLYYRVCGENLFAKHSLFYDNLESYLYGFAIFDDNNFRLSIDEMLIWFEELDIKYPKILYRGIFDEKIINNLINILDFTKVEGFVVSSTESFHYNEYSKSTCKFVRNNHVQTDKHWKSQEIIKNGLKV